MSIAEGVKLLLAAINSPPVKARVDAQTPKESARGQEEIASELTPEEKAQIIKDGETNTASLKEVRRSAKPRC